MNHESTIVTPYKRVQYQAFEEGGRKEMGEREKELYMDRVIFFKNPTREMCQIYNKHTHKKNEFHGYMASKSILKYKSI